MRVRQSVLASSLYPHLPYDAPPLPAGLNHLWLEGATTGEELAAWQGHINHVTPNYRRYIQILTDITQFTGNTCRRQMANEKREV